MGRQIINQFFKRWCTIFAFVVMPLLGCADAVTPETTCDSWQSEEPPGTGSCIVTLSGCSDGVGYEVLCTENVTTECSCVRDGLQVSVFTSPTTCPWIGQALDACGWNLLIE